MRDELRQLADLLIGTEYERQVWLVGGAVRDELLGLPSTSDVDLVTELDALKLAQDVAEKANCAPPDVYPRFGTAMVRLGTLNVEFVTARKESYSPESRKPEVETASLTDDALRRDFTVNSLMKNLHSGELIDHTGMGLADLKSRILRTPLEPEQTFFDDPLRMLRAVRFRWKLGFEYAPDLKSALSAQVERLKSISWERIHDEFEKCILGPNPTGALNDLHEFRLLEQFAPELAAMKGVEQGKYHESDVWGHTMRVIENAAEADLVLRLSCLFHDIGKPPTRTIDTNGDIRFFSHETVGADMAADILDRLKFGRLTVLRVKRLVKNHMRFGSASKFSDSAARRVIREMEDDLDLLLKLVEADASALKAGVRVFDLGEVKATLARVRLATPAQRLASPLTGEEIMELLGASPGPIIGEAQKHLLELVLDGALIPDDKESAAERLKVWAASGQQIS